ncbi:MAG TPA: hypothetical protein VE959_13645 [Bryobacteraceae bacterium]|nr:hypothetical protein [Bryobacteraceae bacterium]
MKNCLRSLLVCAIAASFCAAQTQKKYKDQGEYDIYNEVTKDLVANNFSKALADLDTWQQKYAESEFRDDRQLLYVQSYVGAKQPAKAVEAARDLLSRGVDALAPANAVKLLFSTAVAIQQIPEPTPEQLEIGDKAARALLTYDKKPEGLGDDSWTQARGQLQSAARGALIYVSLFPGTVAMKKNDCAAAETAFQRALADNPDSAQAAWYLGTAELCLYRKAQPEKAPIALYEFARASSVDPAKGMVDPKWQQGTVEPYLEKVYASYHGPDAEGLKQLKEVAALSPLPPADFKIKSVTQIAQEKEAQFEAGNPQLALWLKIKAALADANGEQYFNSTLKDSAVPQLKGVLVEARPACRPKELLVAVPLPDNPQATQAEIKLALDKPLSGKPEPSTEFHWEGVPSAFTANPFLLTMETETAKIDGLKTAPCAAVVAKKAPAKK